MIATQKPLTSLIVQKDGRAESTELRQGGCGAQWQIGDGRDHVPVGFVRIRRAEDVCDEAEAAVEHHRSVVFALVSGAEVEHVGSTAVPGALTKGDVDLLVRVGERGFPAAVESLRGRYVIHQPHNWTPTLASFNAPDAGEIPVDCRAGKS